MADFERDAMLTELVGEPSHAERRMAEDAGSNPGLLDLGVAVHDAAHPAQVDIERADWATADYDPSRGAVVGDRVDNLARVLQASVDDFDRRHDIFSGAQDLGKADARTAQRFAENERQFDLDAR